MKEGKTELRRKEIQQLGLDAIREYFNINPNDLDKSTLIHLHQKAKIGMQFEREMNLSKRAVENNYLRVFRLIAEDKKEMKKLIKKSIPNYLPE